MFKLQRKKLMAQSITEFVILLGIVSLVFITMKVYMQRGIQAAIKVSADEFGNQTNNRDIYLGKGTLESSYFTSETVQNVTRGQENAASYSRSIESTYTSVGDAKYGSMKPDEE